MQRHTKKAGRDTDVEREREKAGEGEGASTVRTAPNDVPQHSAHHFRGCFSLATLSFTSIFLHRHRGRERERALSLPLPHVLRYSTSVTQAFYRLYAIVFGSSFHCLFFTGIRFTFFVDLFFFSLSVPLCSFSECFARFVDTHQ